MSVLMFACICVRRKSDDALVLDGDNETQANGKQEDRNHLLIQCLACTGAPSNVLLNY